MAGDWIKFEHSTLDKPEILRAAEMLGIDVDTAIGIFLRYFVWLDKNLSASCPDFVRLITAASFDSAMRVPGLASVLADIKWCKFDARRRVMYVTNAERHNGMPAKSRALDAKRKRDSRLDSVRQTSASKQDAERTREEKKLSSKPGIGTIALDAPPESPKPGKKPRPKLQPKRGNGEHWDDNNETTLAKAEELGMRPNPGESYQALQQRIREEISRRWQVEEIAKRIGKGQSP